jgi:DHA1 family tetracycline resistance protein-like MFS transporter
VSSRRPAVIFVFITLLLEVLGFGLLIPVGPRLVMELQGGGEQEAAPVVGWLAATYAGMQFIFAPILGALSDRFGRRPVLLLSTLGSGLDYFAMAIAPNLMWLFITRALNGISGAAMTAASAYIADVSPPEKRAQAFGMIGAAFGIGFILGPLIGGLLGDIDIRYPFLVAGGVTLLNLAYGYFVLPESLQPENRAKFTLKNAHVLGAMAKLGRYPLVAGLAGAAFLMNLANFALHATWVLSMSHRFNWNGKQVGLSLFLVGLTSAIVQGGLAGKLVKSMGERRAYLLGVAAGAAAFLGYGLATKGWMIYAIIVGASIGGVAMPASQAMITKTVEGDEQGAVQGGLTSLQSLAQIFGPVMGGYIFTYSITGGGSFPGLVYVVGAGLIVLGLVVALMAMRRVDRLGDATKIAGAES